MSLALRASGGMEGGLVAGGSVDSKDVVHKVKVAFVMVDALNDCRAIIRDDHSPSRGPAATKEP